MHARIELDRKITDLPEDDPEDVEEQTSKGPYSVLPTGELLDWQPYVGGVVVFYEPRSNALALITAIDRGDDSSICFKLANTLKLDAANNWAPYKKPEYVLESKQELQLGDGEVTVKRRNDVSQVDATFFPKEHSYSRGLIHNFGWDAR